MNVIFFTQNRSLDVFAALEDQMARSVSVENAGYYVADQRYYAEYTRAHGELGSKGKMVLKEWDIYASSENSVLDLDFLREAEDRLGDPVLWNAIVADRRIYLGERSTIEQDYASRLDHEQQLKVLQTAIKSVEDLFDRVRPDIVVGFICVTIGDYVGYLVARQRGVPYVNLRPTRCQNYFIAGDSIGEPPAVLQSAYLTLLKSGLDEKLRKKVDDHLEVSRRGHAMYEGVLPAGQIDKPRPKADFQRRIFGVIETAKQRFRVDRERMNGAYRFDSHYHPGLYWFWLEKVKKPLRRAIAKRWSRHDIDLASTDYVFFPLHKEPEVTLLVHGRGCLNQIEVVRNLARSLPVGMKVIVKEHPAAVGYRSSTYYRKLSEITNVELVPASMTSRELVRHAKLVAVIAGSIGFEALILKKPVVIFGEVPFKILPTTMAREVKDMSMLGGQVGAMLSEHHHDEAALRAYIGAIFTGGIPVDFYTKLLKRKDAYAVDPQAEEAAQLTTLAEYILSQSGSNQRRAQRKSGLA